MISSCCTLRLKRRSAFSRDSLSWIMTSATFTFTPNPGRIGYVRCYSLVRTPPLVIIAWQPLCGHAHADGLQLRVPTGRFRSTCPLDHILTCAPLRVVDSP